MKEEAGQVCSSPVQCIEYIRLSSMRCCPVQGLKSNGQCRCSRTVLSVYTHQDTHHKDEAPVLKPGDYADRPGCRATRNQREQNSKPASGSGPHRHRSLVHAMVDCTLLCRVRKSCARFRMRTRAPFFRVLASIFMCFAQYCSRENPSAPSAGISFSVSCDESLDAPSSLLRFSEHKARATCAVCAFALHGTNV